MTEETTNEGQSQPAEVSGLDVNELLEELKSAKSSKERLLSESKDWKSKYTKLREDLEKEERGKLEQNEQFKELVEIEKNRNHELKTQLDQLKETTLESNLVSSLTGLAKDAHDSRMLLSAMPGDYLAHDPETLRWDEDKLKLGIEKLKETKPFLFKQPASTVSGKPQAMLNEVDSSNRPAVERLLKAFQNV